MHPEQNGEWQKNVFRVGLTLTSTPYAVGLGYLSYIFMYEFGNNGNGKGTQKNHFRMFSAFLSRALLFVCFFFIFFFFVCRRRLKFTVGAKNLCGIICACDGRKCILIAFAFSSSFCCFFVSLKCTTVAPTPLW